VIERKAPSELMEMAGSDLASPKVNLSTKVRELVGVPKFNSKQKASAKLEKKTWVSEYGSNTDVSEVHTENAPLPTWVSELGSVTM
jgi:hypothetical protein